MEMQERNNSLRDYMNILKRRKVQMFLTFFALMALTILGSLALPSIYRSTAKILLEEQEVSDDYDRRQSATEYADARVYKVQQRALTSINLAAIIDKFSLYQDDIDRVPRSELIEEMREKITQELVSADVIDPRSGRPTRVTIAFDLSFDHRNPVTAQKVANELVDLYRSENIEQSLGDADDTAEFYQEQVELTNREVLDLEDRLARFKAENEGALPEFVPLMLQLMQRSEKDAEDARRTLSSLEERKIFLESSLLQTEPYSSSGTSQLDLILDPEQEIEVIRGQLRSARATYGSSHPDVRRLEKQLSILTGGAGSSFGNDIASLDNQISMTEAELSQARQTYSSQHPEVIRLERILRNLQSDRSNLSASGGDSTRYVVTNSRVSQQINVRQGPSSTSDVITVLSKGEQAVLVDSSNGQWNKIALNNGQQGFVSKNWTQVVGSGGGSSSQGGQDRSKVPTNPAYITLQANLASVVTQMRSLGGQYNAMIAKANEYSEALNKAPLVEREYSAIMRDLTDKRASLQNYKQELERAEFSQNVTRKQRGQKFTLIEPPIAPVNAHWPNRVALLFLGLVLSLFGTVAMAVVAESLDTGVRKASDIMDISGAAPLAAIPVIKTAGDISKRRRKYMIAAIAALVALILALLLIHIFYRPLPVLWFLILRRLGM